MFRVMKPALAAATAGIMAASVMVGPGSAVAKSGTGSVRAPGAQVHVTQAKRLPALLNCANARLVRPRGEVVLACGDGNAMIAKTVWSSWTSTQATGVTKFYLNACTPSCAGDSMKGYSNAKVRLHDVVSTKRGLLFSEATISYRSHGKTHTLTFDLAD